MKQQRLIVELYEQSAQGAHEQRDFLAIMRRKETCAWNKRTVFFLIYVYICLCFCFFALLLVLFDTCEADCVGDTDVEKE